MSGETVVKITRVQSGVDRYNKPVFSDVHQTISEVAVAPGATSINQTTGEIIATRGFTVYLPEGVTAEPDARFTVRGKTYPVDGASQQWGSHVGWSTEFDSWTPGNVVALSEKEFVTP